MARQTEDVEIHGGRDAGKVFRITEMDAESGEWFAFRLLAAVMDADKDGKLAEIANLVKKAGSMELVASAGMQTITQLMAQADPDRIRPLMDEMKACWQIRTPSGVIRKLVDEDIEEISTLLTLRIKTMELHLRFFTASVQSSTP